MNLKVGDMVRVKGQANSPMMVVSKINTSNNDVKIIWYAINQERFRYEYVPADTLEIYEKDNQGGLVTKND